MATVIRTISIDHEALMALQEAIGQGALGERSRQLTELLHMNRQYAASLQNAIEREIDSLGRAAMAVMHPDKYKGAA